MKAKVYLVDTAVWIEAFKDSQQSSTKKVQGQLRWLAIKNKLVTTGMVLAEFATGLGKNPKDQFLANFLERFDYLNSSKEIYLLAGKLAADLNQKGLATPLSDCLLAATAMLYEVTLLTADSHFKRFKNLKLKFIN